MKKQIFSLAAILIGATVAQAQVQSGGQSSSSGTATGGSASQSQPSQDVNQRSGSQRPIDINQPRDPGPDERILFENQPGQPAQPGQFGRQQAPPFGGTNQVQFGSTNLPSVATTNPAFGTTNPPAFGATNAQPTPFGTNQPPVAGQGGLINEAAGARSAATNRPGQLPGTQGQGYENAADQAFGQQLRAALARTGATQVYFPQTRSTITVLNQNGTVTLRGYVASEEERRSIESRVQSTPGITAINNQLQLSSGQIRGIDPAANPAPGTETNRQLFRR